jgi:hypothetical protein
MREPIFGTLDHFRTIQRITAGAVYNVYLYDEYGADTLNDIATDLVINTEAGPTLLRAQLLDTNQVRTIVVGGLHTFRVTNAAAAYGTFDLFYWPTVRDELTTAQLAGGSAAMTVVLSSPYTILTTDEVILVDTDGGAITVNLPAGVEGKHYKICNVGTSGNDVTITPDGNDEVYGGGAGVSLALIDAEVVNLHYSGDEKWW